MNTGYLNLQSQQQGQQGNINGRVQSSQVANSSSQNVNQHSQNQSSQNINKNQQQMSYKSSHPQKYQQNQAELSTPKQRYNYSRSMTDNFQSSQTKLRPQSSIKDVSPQHQSSMNGFPSSYNQQQNNHQGQITAPISQQNQRNIKSGNNMQQQYYQIQNYSGPYQQHSFSSYSAQQSSLPQNSPALSTQSSSNKQQSEGEQQTSQSLHYQQQQQGIHNVKQNNNSNGKKNVVSQNNYFIQSSLSNINDYSQNTSNLNNSNNHSNIKQNSLNLGGVYNPYSLNKLTPTKTRQNQTSHTRNGLNIETSSLNYGNLNTPYISSMSASNLGVQRSINNASGSSSNISSSRNPYYIGLYSNKSLSNTSKDMSLIRSSVQDTSSSQPQTHQNNISHDQAHDKGNLAHSTLVIQNSGVTNTHQGNLTSNSIINTPGTNSNSGAINSTTQGVTQNSRVEIQNAASINQSSGIVKQQSNISQMSSNQSNPYSNSKSKSPKLTSASFAQLKSPIAQNKVFLSPQSKFTIGFNNGGSNSTSVTSRKQSSGNNSINLFQNTSSHQHVNSSHSTSRVQSSNSGINSNHKILSTSTQALPISQTQTNSINLTNQSAGNQYQNLGDILNKSSNLISNNTTASSKKEHTTSQINQLQSFDKNNNILANIDKNHSQQTFNQDNVLQTIEKNNQQFTNYRNNPEDREESKLNNEKKISSIQINQQKMEKGDHEGLTYENSNQASLHNSIIELIQTSQIPNYEKTKYSVKRNGIVKSYGANTNQGLIRNYNEDRVSIILNIMKPQGKITDNNMQWPKCSFFGVYDGHGGVLCADFLRDNLHQFVIKDSNFPKNPKQAIINGFDAAEKQFLKQAQQKEGAVEKSGSCAIVVMIVASIFYHMLKNLIYKKGTKCYVANVGDSRAIMSGSGGTKAYELSRDHKPLDEIEQKRIAEAGGKIYQYILQFEIY